MTILGRDGIVEVLDRGTLLEKLRVTDRVVLYAAQHLSPQRPSCVVAWQPVLKTTTVWGE